MTYRKNGLDYSAAVTLRALTGADLLGMCYGMADNTYRLDDAIDRLTSLGLPDELDGPIRTQLKARRALAGFFYLGVCSLSTTD